VVSVTDPYGRILGFLDRMRKALIDASVLLLSRQQNVGQNWDMKIANRSFENVSQFKYLGTTVTNQNLIQGEN
jgi:hypothetical protein